MSSFFMGIDNGGTVCKVALYDNAGSEIALASRKIDMIYPQPGFTEKNMKEFWTANAEAISEVVSKSAIEPSQIAGIAATGHGNGMFLVDEDGEAVGNGIISTDSRAGSYVKRWYEDGTFEKINRKTLQSIWAAQPVALLNWYKDNRPEELSRAKWVLMCKDFIRYRLTGEAFAEITDYSGTNLVNVLTGEYDDELFDDFGILDLKEKLPPLRKSTDICGRVTAEAAALTGLAEGTPVMGGFFDIDACAIATGLTDEQDLSVIAGTWSINQFISREPVGSDELFMTSLYGMPGYWLVTEASPTSASNLEWFIENLTDGASYEDVNNAVESVGPDESDVIFFPYLFGSNAGDELSSCFLGLNGWHGRAHMMRAVFEGVVFGHRLHVERLMKHRGQVRKIRISGGASKSKLWVQMFADILQMPVEVTEADELGTLGAAICAAVGSGEYADFDEASIEMVRFSKLIEPDPGMAAVYDGKYRKFSRYLEAIRNC